MVEIVIDEQAQHPVTMPRDSCRRRLLPACSPSRQQPVSHFSHGGLRSRLAFDFRLNAIAISFLLTQVILNEGAVTEIVGDDSVDVRELHGRKHLTDFFGCSAKVEVM